jgi:type IV secretion system protein VirB10
MADIELEQQQPDPINGQHGFEPPEAVISGSRKPAKSNGPLKQNKSLILRVGIGAAVFIVVAVVMIPALFPKKQKREDTPRIEQPQEVQPTDYSRLAEDERKRRGAAPPAANQDGDALPPLLPADNGDAIPPIPATDMTITGSPQQMPYQMPAELYQPQYVYHSSSGGSGSSIKERPATNADQLQAKAIPGIKGLTPSQQRYASGAANYPTAQSPAQTGPQSYAEQQGMPSRDAMMNSLLSQMDGMNAMAGGGNTYAAQNDQAGKMGFYNQGRDNAGQGSYLPQASIWQGTIFDATLLSDINTDLPGECVATLAKNVYSSLDGKYILIPQGSRLFGTYNSSISYAQSRIQVGWHTLVRPDGYAIQLGNMQATDAKGAVGLKGFINDHPFQYLKALALISAFNVMSGELDAYGKRYTGGQNDLYVQNLYANTQDTINKFGGKLIDRALDVQPSIRIAAGTKINIVVNNTLLLPPLDPYPVTQPYYRK